jgi:hypothetical protein
VSNPFGGVTAEQAGAGLSALSCPTYHANAVPVEDLDGERVATLCPDCDRQLPADWKTGEERAKANAEWVEAMEASHRKDHHGWWSVSLLACRLCAEENSPEWWKARETDA